MDARNYFKIYKDVVIGEGGFRAEGECKGNLEAAVGIVSVPLILPSQWQTEEGFVSKGRGRGAAAGLTSSHYPD